jgi:glycosyltransferase involved in cell wall biosynthesis
MVIYDAHEHLVQTIEDKPYIPLPLRKFTATVVEKLENRLARKIDAVITATSFIAGRFSRLNPVVHAINNYPFKDELAATGDWVEKENAVCFIGGITAIRGVAEVVDAMADVSDCTFHLAGTIYGEGLEERLKSSPGWKKVVYHGQVSRQEVQQILSRCKAGIITLLPVANHIHAQPNKMFEYMSAGIPVIGSDFKLWKEIIEGNSCGILVDPLSPRAISAAITQIIDNDEGARRMGENGRIAVLTKFNWEAESEKLVNLYRSLEEKTG